ncbi:MAG: hypothetical protein Q9192_006251 [Flavoplaca navasiana]
MADAQNVAYAAALYTFIRTFVAKDAERFAATLKAPPKASEEYQHYILAYAESFKVVFVVLTALTALAGLLSLLIKEHTMDRVLDSEHTLRQRQHPNKPETTITDNNMESDGIS